MGISSQQITGLILAGGRGMRMGGVDKGLETFRGKPLVCHAMQRLTPQVASVMINANRHRDRYAEFGAPVIPDATADFAGPLAGLHAGLSRCGTDYLATVPCDTPLFPEDLVQRLSIALDAGNGMAAIAVTEGKAGRQNHPVFCLLRRAALPSLDRFLKDGGRRVGEWLHAIGCAEAQFDDDMAFTNLNTREELEAFARRPA